MDKTQPRRTADPAAADWSRGGTHDLVELCRRFHEAVSHQMDAPLFFFGLYDATSQTVEVVWDVENGRTRAGGSVPLGTGLISQVIQTGTRRIIRRGMDQAQRGAAPASDSGVPESAIAVPLKLSTHTIGLVCVQSLRPDAYAERDFELLESMADQAALVVAGLHYSQRLGAQSRRRVSEFEAILANMADAVLMIDARGSLVRLNRAAQEILGLDEASLGLGQPLDAEQWDAWPASGRAAAQALRLVIDHLQRTEESRDVEIKLGGVGRRTLSFHVNPLRDADGAFSGGVVVFREVTSRGEVQRFKDEVLSIASHDLRTPATVIKAQAQWLKRRVGAGSPVDRDVQEGLTMIADQADRLARLLNLLLDLSRIEAGRLDLQLEPTNLGDIVATTARALQTTTDAHRIDVRSPVGVIGQWDLRRVEEVINNLLNNSVKYSPQGGQIDVRITADDAWATVRVQDSGIGLSAEEVLHVFERYYRGPHVGRLDGTGLGLYICHAIVSAHGGRIWAESAGRGQGSTFGLTLPLSSR